MDEISLEIANRFGCAGLVVYILTLMPTNFRVLFPFIANYKPWRFFFKDPRAKQYMGILAYAFSLVHAVPIVIHRDINLLDPMFYVFYFSGAISFAILTAMAITSNRFSQRLLKKNWKKLHELTYLCLFLLAWHVISAMWGKWDWLTWLMSAVANSVIVLFLLRRIVEVRNSRHRQVIG